MPAPDASPNKGRFAPTAVVALTVVMFGVVVAAVTLQLRAGVHTQLLRDEADKLAGVVSMQLDNVVEDLQRSGIALESAPGTVFVAVLKTSKFPGVAGVTVFDSQQRASGAFGILFPESPAADEWSQLRTGRSIAHFHARGAGEEKMLLLPVTSTGPMIEAWVPLRPSGSGAFIGAAQFWVVGKKFSAEMGEHDQRLWAQAAIAWLVGSIVIVVGLSWAFRRLGAANTALRARTEDLQRANRELVLAAKTSALGAVTAHLMHELKNPLAGLEVIVAGQAEGERAQAGGELAAASELTRRLRTMVNDVVGVLRDEQTGAEFELTAADIIEIALGKVRPDANARGVKIETGPAPDAAVAGRRANLATLVLRNLLQNAIEATPAGGTVGVSAGMAADGGVELVVQDGGGGLPDPVRQRLFQPVSSTKVGGSGLGLALSYQLAQQAGGRLELVESGARGTSFRLVLAREA